jgi:hypothetical protein
MKGPSVLQNLNTSGRRRFIVLSQLDDDLQLPVITYSHHVLFFIISIISSSAVSRRTGVHAKDPCSGELALEDPGHAGALWRVPLQRLNETLRQAYRCPCQ